MRVSVITTCLNAQSCISRTLDSVLMQNHDDLEHLVIDAHSSDDTLLHVESRRERYRGRGYDLVVHSQSDSGVYDGMNRGLRMASGDVVGFLNAGDVFASKNVISLMADYINLGAQCVFGNVAFVDDNGETVRMFNSPDLNSIKLYGRDYAPSNTILSRLSRYRNAVLGPTNRLGWSSIFARGLHPAHPTFYARREVYDRDFDLRYSIAGDFEMMLYLLEVKRISSRYINHVLVYMSDGGMSNKSAINIMKANVECYRACRQHHLDVSPLFVVRKPLGKLSQFKSILSPLRKLIG